MTQPRSQPVETAARLPGLGELSEHRRGTACVRSIAVRAHETLLTLGYPGGREVMVALPGTPGREDNPGARESIRPLAVLIRNRQARVDCSLLGTSGRGPSRVVISLEQALALCRDGVHTVLRNES